MKISVVVPTLNAEKFIGHCLSSITGQGADTEVIVVDGGSKDSTVQRARAFKAKVIEAPPKGEPNAINIGLKAATGDVLAWLDADDVYESGALRVVAHHFVRHPDSQWAYGRCRIIDEEGKEIRQTVTKMKELVISHYSYSMLLIGDFIPQPATFFRKSAFEFAGLLLDNERLVFDYAYWLRLGWRFSPSFIDTYLASWRAHEGSISVQQYRKEADDAYRVASTYVSGGRKLLTPLRKALHWYTIKMYEDMARVELKRKARAAAPKADASPT